MIRALLGDEDTPLKTIVIGLSRKNLDNMIAGHPIFKDMKDMGFPDLCFAIFFGETEEAMRDEFRSFVKNLGIQMEEVDQRKGDKDAKSDS